MHPTDWFPRSYLNGFGCLLILRRNGQYLLHLGSNVAFEELALIGLPIQ